MYRVLTIYSCISLDMKLPKQFHIQQKVFSRITLYVLQPSFKLFMIRIGTCVVTYMQQKTEVESVLDFVVEACVCDRLLRVHDQINTMRRV